MKASGNKEQPTGRTFEKKLLSRKMVNYMSRHQAGQLLKPKEAKWVALEVKRNLARILFEAESFARRTRSPEVRRKHMQYVANFDEGLPSDMLTHFVSLNFVLETRPREKQCKEAIVRLPVPQKKKTIVSSAPQKAPPVDPPPINGWIKREKVIVKPMQRYPLSREEQSFYEAVTDNLASPFESRRQRALSTLSLDPSVEVILPKLSHFIADTTTVNIIQQNVPILLYVMRMVRALVGNPGISVFKCLHLILPSVLSCLLSCDLSPSLETHWPLREYAGNIITETMRKYDHMDNKMFGRIISVYKAALQRKPLTTVYGAVIGLGKLGNFSVRACILPQLRKLSKRIEPILKESSDNQDDMRDKQICRYIRHRIVKVCTPVLKAMRRPPDRECQYVAAFGFLGEALCASVITSRIRDQTAAFAARGMIRRPQVIKAKAAAPNKPALRVLGRGPTTVVAIDRLAAYKKMLGRGVPVPPNWKPNQITQVFFYNQESQQRQKEPPLTRTFANMSSDKRLVLRPAVLKQINGSIPQSLPSQGMAVNASIVTATTPDRVIPQVISTPVIAKPLIPTPAPATTDSKDVRKHAYFAKNMLSMSRNELKGKSILTLSKRKASVPVDAAAPFVIKRKRATELPKISQLITSRPVVDKPVVAKGKLPNGTIPNGIISKGMIPNGMIPNVIIPNGKIPNVVIPNGRISLIPSNNVKIMPVPNRLVAIPATSCIRS